MDQQQTNQTNIKNKNTAISKKATLWFVLFVTTLGLLIAFVVAYALKVDQSNNYGTSLEQVYQKSYYDLVDNINTTEAGLGKLVVSTSGEYQTKLIKEVAESSKSAQSNASYLPLSNDGISQTVGFLNKVYGYLSILEEKTSAGQSLSGQELKTLSSIYESVSQMKQNLARITSKLQNGDSIISQIKPGKDGMNMFTKSMQQIKSDEANYPTMIYDGPFSDSVLNKAIKGLEFSTVSQDDAKNAVSKFFNISDDLVEFSGESGGKIETYNFVLQGDENGFVQVSKKGAKLITQSAIGEGGQKNYSLEDVEKTAAKFAIDCGVEEVEVVWSDVIDGDAYINLAPVSNDVILYPDLVKVKVDLASGKIVGYEASSYYTNHTKRNIPNATYDVGSAEKKIDNTFNVLSKKLALAPLDYNREVLCHEIKCTRDNDVYYYYFNAQNGELENILKVVETESGGLLM